MADAGPRGRFVWFDLMTTDQAGAIDFYTKITNWGTTASEGPLPYTMWTNGGTPLGGVMPLSPEAEAPPHWLAYISAPDTDATVVEANGLGAATVVPPTDIPAVGRFAVMSDPQGAVFAIYTHGEGVPGHDGPPAVGEFSWHELMTTDQAAAFGFYQRLFGWDKGQSMDMGPAGVYQIYRRNGVDIGGMFNRPNDQPGGPAWMHYIMVKDIQRAAEAAKELGGQVINGPMEVPGGDWIFQAIDPQGAMFAMHARR